MARLINDSKVLGESVEITAEEVKNVPFDKVIEAIHVIQQDIGITGTTTAEALDTIEGSSRTFGAAWQNLLTGMADDNADFSQLVKNFTDSLVAYLRNMLPRIKQVVKGIGEMINGVLKELTNLLDDEFVESIAEVLNSIIQTIAEALPKILEQGVQIVSVLAQGIVDTLPNLATQVGAIIPTIVTGLTDLLPSIVEAGVSVVTSLVNGFAQALPELVPAIANMVLTIADNLIANLPTIIDAGINLIMGLAQGIINAIPEIVKKIPDLITGLVNGIIEGIPKMIQAALELFSSIWEAIPQVVNDTVRQIPKIIAAIVEALAKGAVSIVKVAAQMFLGITDGAAEAKEKMSAVTDGIQEYADKLDEVSPKIANANNMFSSTGQSMGEIDSQISEIEGTITEIYRLAFAEQEGLRQEDIDNIRKYQEQLVELEREKLGIYRGLQQAEITKIKLDSEITQEEAAQYIANSKEALTQANQAAEAAYTARLTEIERFHQAAGTIGSQQYEAEIMTAQNYYNRSIAENEGYYNEAIGMIQDKSKEWVAADKDKYDWANEYLDKYRKDTHSGLEYVGDVIGDFVGGWSGYVDDYADALSFVVDENSRGFMNMATAVKAGGGEIDEETKGVVTSILNNFEGLPDDFDEVGKEALAGLTYGMEDYIPELKDTSEMSAQEIVDAIKDYLDINSPSVVMEEIGGYVVDGLVSGMENGEPEVTAAAQSIADMILGAFDKEDSAMANIGKRVASQIGSGISNGLRDVTTSIQSVIDKITQMMKLQDNNFKQLGIKVITQINAGLVFKRSTLTETMAQIVGAMRQALLMGVTQMFNVGQQMANGLWAGFISQEGTLSYKLRNMMQRLVNTAKNEMQIHSPSKVWGQVGGYMAQGLGVGFTDEMQTVTKDIAQSLPKGAGVTGNTAARIEADDRQMVRAFKEALSEMKIELDDKQVGSFVDKTITRLVYA